MLAPWAFILLLAVTGALSYFLSDAFRFEIDHAFATVMTGDQQLIRDYLLGFGVWAPVVSIVLMVAQVIVVGIPATIVLFANGVAFGTLGGATLNIVGRMLGAIVAFGLARVLGKGAVEKLVGRLTHADRFEGWMSRWGGWAIFATRAIPGMPSDVFSYVAGFTNVSWRTYLIATFFGFLPQSILYAWLGSAATGWFWAVMLFGTVVSATIAASVVTVQAIRRWRIRRAAMVV
jgi:uncharacterized membrane protein YdjX (TVP38/TMEM64 family)